MSKNRKKLNKKSQKLKERNVKREEIHTDTGVHYNTHRNGGAYGFKLKSETLLNFMF